MVVLFTRSVIPVDEGYRYLEGLEVGTNKEGMTLRVPNKKFG